MEENGGRTMVLNAYVASDTYLIFVNQQCSPLLPSSIPCTAVAEPSIVFCVEESNNKQSIIIGGNYNIDLPYPTVIPRNHPVQPVTTATRIRDHCNRRLRVVRTTH